MENGRCLKEVLKVMEPRKRGEEVRSHSLAASLRMHGIFPNIRIPTLSRGGDERCKWGERKGGILYPKQRVTHLVNKFLGHMGVR